MTKVFVTVEEYQAAATFVADQIRSHVGHYLNLYGVPRGGIPAAFAVAAMLNSHKHVRLVNDAAQADYIIDDIYDSGATARRYAWTNVPFLALFDKRNERWAGKWLVLPNEVSDRDTSGDDIVVRLLEFLGEDPSREGLKETPERVLKAWKEWASGYGQDPAKILKTFTDGADKVDEMVIVHNIPVVSKCEHHLADIIGTAHVGYIPNGKIVGLSKIPRLVDCFGRRLQVQERLTNQIADALDAHLQPKGVGVVIRAAHHCMSGRGVRIHGSTTTTSAMRGAILDKPSARAEFLQLCALAEKSS